MAAMALIDAHKVSVAAMQVANHHIAKLLGDGKRAAHELAAAAKVNARALETLLRLLSGHGCFQESKTEPGVFSNTDLSWALEHAQPYAAFFSHHIVQEAWSEVAHSLETGQSAIQKCFGEPSLVRYALGKDPDLASIFFRMLGFLGSLEVPAVLGAYDFSRCRGVMDVGGANGEFLSEIAKRCPTLERYVLFDLPHMADSPQAHNLMSAFPPGRGTAIAGDASKSVPRIDGVDTIVHKYFLHDFDDDRAVKFLENDYAALPEGGKVLIVEQISKSGGNRPRYANTMDLIMLINEGGGYVRTVERHAENLAKAGFRLQFEIETSMPISILEAVKT